MINLSFYYSLGDKRIFKRKYGKNPFFFSKNAKSTERLIFNAFLLIIMKHWMEYNDNFNE